MSKAEQFREFARECIASAENTNDVDQRETLLELAMQWAFAAARLDHEKSSQWAALQVNRRKRKVPWGGGGAASASRDRGEENDAPAK